MSNIFVIKNRDAANIPLLFRLVVKHIFDPMGKFDNGVPFSREDRKLMEDSFDAWYKKLQLDEETGRLDEAQRDSVQMLAKMLVDNEQGLLDKKKWILRDRNIDPFLYFRIKKPSIIQQVRAKEAYDSYKLKNPQQEGLKR